MEADRLILRPAHYEAILVSCLVALVARSLALAASLIGPRFLPTCPAASENPVGRGVLPDQKTNVPAAGTDEHHDGKRLRSPRSARALIQSGQSGRVGATRRFVPSLPVVFDPDPAAVSWAGAQFVGYQVGNSPGATFPAIVVRKTFTPAKAVKKATLQATALGSYIPYFNGQRVGDHEMAPGWTDYSKRRQFQTYDVTALVTSGQNAVGMEVGDGWFLGKLEGAGYNYYGADVPRGMMALRLVYSDDTTETIVSDGTWKATTSDNTKNDWYNGSTHDARLLKDWSRATTSDAGWTACTTIAGDTVPLVKQPSYPARRVETLTPIARTNPATGTYIFDMGKNHAGYCSIRVDGAAAGTTVQLRHGEALKKDGSGTLYTANLRGAQQTDRFITSGATSETFEPRHTFHGYRYVEVTGYPGVPPMDCIKSFMVYNSAPTVSTFSTDSTVLQATWDAGVQSWKSNALSIPSDCPQRDERMGWGADAHIFAEAATYVQDVAAFYDKYCDDLDDSTLDGKVGTVAPYVSVVQRGNSGWGDAAVFIPWTMYQAYGDTKYLTRHFANMKAVLAAQPYSDVFGDYLNTNEAITADAMRYAFAYRVASVVKRTADVLGDTDAASTAASSMATFKTNFNSLVSNSGGTIGNSNPTNFILALGFDILDEANKPRAIDGLILRLAINGAIKSGFIGLAYIFDALTNNGEIETAYAFAEKLTSPSLGFQLADGMTTLGEQWDPKATQTATDNANSYNHFIRGAVLAWIARNVAGITPATPGFSTVLLRPRPGGSATRASMTYASKAGTISTNWSLDAARNMTWTFRLPVTGIVSLPLGYTSSSLAGAAGVTSMTVDSLTGGLRYSVPAGSYSITAQAPADATARRYVYAPGISSPAQGVRTPVTTANQPAGFLDKTVVARIDAPNANTFFLAGASHFLCFTPARELHFVYYNGSNAQFPGASAALPADIFRKKVWFRAILNTTGVAVTTAGQTTPANTLRYMYSLDGATWTTITTRTGVTTAMTSGSTTGRPLSIAPYDSDNTARNASLRGRVYGMTLVDGAGAVVASPDCTTLAPGTTSFADAQGNVWTVAAPCVVR